MAFHKPDTNATFTDHGAEDGSWSNIGTSTPDWSGREYTGVIQYLFSWLRSSWTGGGSYPSGEVKRWRPFVDIDVSLNETGGAAGVIMYVHGVDGFTDGYQVHNKIDGTATAVRVYGSWKSPDSGTVLADLSGVAKVEFETATDDGKGGAFALELNDWGLEYELVTDVGGGGGGGPGAIDVDQTVEVEVEGPGSGEGLSFFASGRGLLVPQVPLATELKATTSASAAKLGDTSGKQWRAASFSPAVDDSYGQVSAWLRRVGNPRGLVTVYLQGNSGGLPVAGAPDLFVGQIVAADLETTFEERVATTAKVLSYRTRVLEAGPAHFYRFKDFGGSPANTQPELPGGRPLVGTGVTEVAGFNVSDVSGGALSFDGSNDELASVLSPLTTRNALVAVECWAKLVSSDQGVIWHNGSHSGNTGFGLNVGAANALQLRRNGTNSATGYTMTVGSWVHLVVTHDGVNWAVWADGVRVYQNATAVSAYSAGVTSFGSDGSAAQFLNVAVSEVALYEHQLSDDEIRAHYAIGRFGQMDAGLLQQSLALDNALTYWVLLFSDHVDASHHVEIEYGTNGGHGSGEELAESAHDSFLFEPASWGGAVTGGAHLRIAEQDDRGYRQAAGEMMETIPDVLRFVAGELAGIPYPSLDNDAFDAATIAGLVFAGNLVGLGESFDEWWNGLAFAQRAEACVSDGASSTLYRLFAANLTYDFGAVVASVDDLRELVETLRGRDELATRLRAFFDFDPSLGTGEEAFRQVVRADPEESDVPLFPATTLEALETAGGARTHPAFFLLLVRDKATAIDWLGWQAKLRAEVRSSFEGPWPMPVAYALEPGDVVNLSPPSGGSPVKCQVFSTELDLWSPALEAVAAEVT
jgi:hypothetical protein